MDIRAFAAFSKMLAKLPAEAVLPALDLECRMLESDLEFHRLEYTEYAFSILSFRQFIRMLKNGGTAMRCLKPLPPDHAEFYKETIVRLVQANELPDSAMEQFDETFHRIL